MKTNQYTLVDHLPCGVISTLPDGTIVFANATFLTWIGRNAKNRLVNQRFQDLLTVPGRIFYETHFAPLLRMQGFVNEIACQLERPQAPPLDVLVTSRLEIGPGEAPSVIRTVLFDATERKRYEDELRTARNKVQHFAAIIAGSKDAIISTGTDDLVQTWNKGATEIFGYTESEAKGRKLGDLIVPENRRMEREQKLASLLEGMHVSYPDTVRSRKDGTPVAVEITASPLFNDESQVVGMSSIFREITERKRAEEKNAVLMGEVNHRSKNLLSVVQAIAKQTAQGGDPQTFVTRLEGRLRGLAASQDLLVKNNWERINLGELVRVQLAHFGDVREPRIRTAGPTVALSPMGAQSIGMALHELATNAVKYGALSNSTGRVSITWQISASPKPKFTMTWTEEGGPPVSAPSTQGFGYKVLRQMAETSINADVHIEYHREGLRWSLTTDMENLTRS